jgi:hypothetical protein
MFFQLSDAKSSNPDFKPPTRRNGEALTLFSVATSGSFIISRYFGEEAIAGPAVERFFVDVYPNHYGREAFRVTAKILEPPPRPPNLWQRIGRALAFVFLPQCETGL